MGFKNFTEYWEARKTILDVARMIWGDACDAVTFGLLDKMS